MFMLNSMCLIKCLNEKLIDFFIVLCCVYMSSNPNKIRLGKETINSSARKEGQDVCPFTKRGRGHRSGEGSSQTDPSYIDPRKYYEEDPTITSCLSMRSRLKRRVRLTLSSKGYRRLHSDRMVFLEALVTCCFYRRSVHIWCACFGVTPK